MRYVTAQWISGSYSASLQALANLVRFRSQGSRVEDQIFTICTQIDYELLI